LIRVEVLVLRQDNLIIDLVGLRACKRAYKLGVLYFAAALPLAISLHIIVQATLGGRLHYFIKIAFIKGSES
jgi:hypothetical protein